VFEKLGVEFDLDPCSPFDRVLDWIPAKKRYTVVDNGLLKKWEGFVFMNPPYGQDTPVWMRKLSVHNDGIALVFSRTDTGWFHQYASKASCICFVKKRICFVRADGRPSGTPGAGSMLVGFGDRAKDVLIKSGLGLCMSFLEESNVKV